MSAPTNGALSARFAGLARSGSLGDLMVKFADIVASLGCRAFQVYLVSDGEAILTYSAGVTTESGGKLDLPDHRWFRAVLEDRKRWRPADALSRADPVFREAHAGFALVDRDDAVQGGLVFFEPTILRPLDDPEARADVLALVDHFGLVLSQLRRFGALERSHSRAIGKLAEFAEGQSILYLSEREEIFDAVLARALRNLGAISGAIILVEDGEWRRVWSQGEDADELTQDAWEHVKRCCEIGSAGLVNALSGESIFNFDIDTIHMAALLAFPLELDESYSGAILAYDATVSLDTIETVQGTARVAATAIENWRVRRKMLDQQRLEEQMSIAASVQSRLLPARQPDFTSLEVAHFSRYCDETGGDYIDAFVCHEASGAISLVVGDVSGHGLGSAMVMVDLRARIRTLLAVGDPWAPERILDHINRALYDETDRGEFVTLFLATFDGRTGTLRYASAGHENPLLYRSESGAVRALEATGIPLGLLRDAHYESRTVVLTRNDVFLGLTDGVTEARTETGELGVEVLHQRLADFGKASASAIVESIVALVFPDGDTASGRDDVSLLVAKPRSLRMEMQKDAPDLDGEKVWSERIDSNPEAKDAFLDTLSSRLEALLKHEDAGHFIVAAEEAVANATEHGSGLIPGAFVDVEWWVGQSAVHLVLHDQGEGFDLEATLAAPFERGARHRVRGRGLVIMAELLDRIVYWNGGRSVALTKSLPKK